MDRTQNVALAGPRFCRVLGAMSLMLALLLGAGSTHAASACTSDETMSKPLERRYAETPIAGGLSQSGKLLQVFSTKDGETWTVVLVRPDGVSCIVAAGRFWQTVAVKDGPQV